MPDWFLNLPLLWMALVAFAATFVVAACVYLVVFRLAVGDLARAFKAFSPGMLPPLGIIFALLVGFVAVQVWNDFDKAKVAVATEASALRAAVLIAESPPDEQRTHLRALIKRHIEEAVNREWPSMAHEHSHARTRVYPPGRSSAAHDLFETPGRDSTHGPAGDSGCVAHSFECAASTHHHQSIRGRAGEVGCNPANGTLHAHCDCRGA
jgi:Protein of unknown function (DUF4239)